ncbi:hypothetical protein Sjap_008575 [Stephania japonica]|uniref:Protein kinase domain-containing protein n=1 Tax=Stephania japonica TaxID=461633 RepID=A0AAP0PEL0_9MAGN
MIALIMEPKSYEWYEVERSKQEFDRSLCFFYSSTAITLFKQVKGCLCAIPDDPPGKGLTLFTRVKILRDCTLALKFLHSYPDGCVVHEAIKLSKILLNNNMEVKLSDLGLAKMLDSKDQPTVSVDLDASSIGYMDPRRGVVYLDFHALDQLIQMAKDVVVKEKGGLSDLWIHSCLIIKSFLYFTASLWNQIFHVGLSV